MLTADEQAELTAEQAAVYASLSPSEQHEFARKYRNGLIISSGGPKSLLLAVGAIGVFISALGAVISFFSGWPVAAYLCVASCMTFAFMWIMGVIEERLIEVVQAIKDTGKR